MTAAGVAMLAVESARTRAYLVALERSELLPAEMIFLTGARGGPGSEPVPVAYFDNETPALERVRRLGLPCTVLAADDPNDAEVVAAVRASSADVVIYSGPGGRIIRPELLGAGKPLLHVHGGVVPRFRGSTSAYYSLLAEGVCGASAIFLAERLDAGPLLATRAFPPPADRATIDGYDPYIRSELLVDVLAEYRLTGEFHPRQQGEEGAETYYVMHPVLRHIAILSKRLDRPEAK